MGALRKQAEQAGRPHMKICSYVIKADTGLAPNPFWRFCSLAVCTPNHQNARLFPGDWIVGNSPVSDGQRLVYAMRVDEVLDFDSYFRDLRFEKKKPNPRGKPVAQAGDNFYFRENGIWKRLPSRFHNGQSYFYRDLGMDLSGRPVFIAQHYYYFGDKRIAFPGRFSGIVRRSQGIRYTKGSIASKFIQWLEENHKPGLIGKPLDQSDHSRECGRMITDSPAQYDNSSSAGGKVPKASWGIKKGC
jgi:hypothetical protein